MTKQWEIEELDGPFGHAVFLMHDGEPVEVFHNFTDASVRLAEIFRDEED